MNSEQFREAILRHAELVSKRHALCKTEEASKTALILPFFRDVLGYDVSDPEVFIPEFVSAASIKKDQRCDYAIIKDGKPIILIEAKWNGNSLDGYESQLYNYFGATSAKLGILTNGVVYRFFGDLDADNRMDISPFREINMLELTEADIRDLEHFQRDGFDIDAVIESATEMKYSNDVKSLLDRMFADPDNEFTAFVMKRVYSGKKTTKNAKNFQAIVKATMDQFIADKASARLNQIQEEEAKEEASALDSGVITTDEEIEAYIIIRTLLRNVVDPSRIQYKDCKSYFGILLDGKTKQWICRLYPSSDALWQIHFPSDDANKPDKQAVDNNLSIHNYQKRLETAAKRYL